MTRALRSPSLVTLILALCLFAPAADASERSGQARFLAVESGVTLQRFTETSSEEASVNLPVFSGDRIWTNGSGRAEIQFPDGSFLLVGPEVRLDVELVDDEKQHVAIRLSSGSVVVGRMDGNDPFDFVIVTPEGETAVEEHALVRVDSLPGETRAAVLSGEAEVSAADRRRDLDEAEEVWMRSGFEPTRAEAIDHSYDDSIDGWARQRWEARDGQGESRQYLPDPLQAYGEDLDGNGTWRDEVGVGAVWYPRVNAGWQPYRYGRWCWTPYGWNWVSAEPWGWAVSHYGSWGFSGSFGWYWSPGRVWAPAHVVWAHGGGHVGWCPKGHNGHAVSHGHRRGHGGRDSFGEHWTFVGSREMGHRDVGRARVDHAVLRTDTVRVADPGRYPTRDGGALADAGEWDRTGAELRQPRVRASVSGGWGASRDRLAASTGRHRPSAFGTDSSTGSARRSPWERRSAPSPGDDPSRYRSLPRQQGTSSPALDADAVRTMDERRSAYRRVFPAPSTSEPTGGGRRRGDVDRTTEQRSDAVPPGWVRALPRPNSGTQRLERPEAENSSAGRRRRAESASRRDGAHDSPAGLVRAQPRPAPDERPRFDPDRSSRTQRREAPARAERQSPPPREREDSGSRAGRRDSGESEGGRGGARRRRE